jgi:hypothetical protein
MGHGIHCESHNPYSSVETKCLAVAKEIALAASYRIPTSAPGAALSVSVRGGVRDMGFAVGTGWAFVEGMMGLACARFDSEVAADAFS